MDRAAQVPPADAGKTVRKRWFRRKRLMIPLVLLVIAGAVIGVAVWRINQSLDRIQDLTTPAPEVSGNVLGGSPDLVIDTGPAQTALAQSTATATVESGATTTDIAQTAPTATDVSGSQVTDVPPTAIPDPTDAAVASDPAGVAPTAMTEPTATAGVVTAAEPGDPTARVVPSAEATGEAPTVATATTAPAPPTSGTLNILLMGVDATDGGPIDTSSRPDVLSVLHLDWSDKSCRLLSIPRDTRVELPGYGLTKVNHALPLGGVPYEQKVVSDYLGIQLDHYGLIDFTGAIKIVDKFGGVEVNNPTAFMWDGFAFPAGQQTLNGDQALAYARYRGGPDGDFGRIGRQQDVLTALLRKVSGSDLIKLIPNTLPTVDGHFRTDLSINQMLDIARGFGSSCTEDTLETRTMDGTIGTFFDPLLQMDLSYVIITDEERRRSVDWLLGN